MAERAIQHRISFANSLEIMEVDFSRLSFTSKEQVDEFYDEVDRQLGDEAPLAFSRQL